MMHRAMRVIASLWPFAVLTFLSRYHPITPQKKILRTCMVKATAPRHTVARWVPRVAYTSCLRKLLGLMGWVP